MQWICSSPGADAAGKVKRGRRTPPSMAPGKPRRAGFVVKQKIEKASNSNQNQSEYEANKQLNPLA